ARDVADDALHRRHAPAGVAQRLHERARPEFDAVDDEIVLASERLAAVDNLPASFAELVGDVRGKQFVDRLADEVFLRQTEIGGGPVVAVEVAAIAIGNEDWVFRRLDDRSVVILDHSSVLRAWCLVPGPSIVLRPSQVPGPGTDRGLRTMYGPSTKAQV